MESRYKNKENYNENKMQVIHERILNLTKDPAHSRKRKKNWSSLNSPSYPQDISSPLNMEEIDEKSSESLMVEGKPVGLTPPPRQDAAIRRRNNSTEQNYPGVFPEVVCNMLRGFSSAPVMIRDPSSLPEDSILGENSHGMEVQRYSIKPSPAEQEESDEMTRFFILTLEDGLSRLKLETEIAILRFFF
jgi:hypothetical protein